MFHFPFIKTNLIVSTANEGFMFLDLRRHQVQAAKFSEIATLLATTLQPLCFHRAQPPNGLGTGQ